jgi:NADP-dependent 3-hydroxy acid dehydrogenase YdfG
VTGSTAGIGLAIGSTLAGEGATVIINGRSEKRVVEAIENIRQKHPHAKLEPLIGDLSKVEAVKQATRSFPHVDILINNLGIYEPKSFEDIADEDWAAIGTYDAHPKSIGLAVETALIVHREDFARAVADMFNADE